MISVGRELVDRLPVGQHGVGAEVESTDFQRAMAASNRVAGAVDAVWQPLRNRTERDEP